MKKKYFGDEKVFNYGGGSLEKRGSREGGEGGIIVGREEVAWKAGGILGGGRERETADQRLKY